MYCSYPSLRRDDLSLSDGNMSRFCDIYESNVVDTKEYTDEVLLHLLQDKPDTCLKVDWNQENIRIVHHV